MREVDQPSSAPTRKVAAGFSVGAVGAIGIAPLVLWVWGLMMPQAEMPVEVAGIIGGGLTWLMQFAASYMTREKQPEEPKTPSSLRY